MSNFGSGYMFSVNKSKRFNLQDEMTIFINMKACPRLEVSLYHDRHLSDFKINCSDDISVQITEFNTQQSEPLGGSSMISCFEFDVPNNSSGFLSFTIFGVTTNELKWEYIDEDTMCLTDFEGETLYIVKNHWRSSAPDTVELSGGRELILANLIDRFLVERDEAGKKSLYRSMVAILAPPDPFMDPSVMAERIALAQSVIKSRILDTIQHSSTAVDDEDYEDEDDFDVDEGLDFQDEDDVEVDFVDDEDDDDDEMH